MEWWGYSKEHGWVVLDRSIPSNAPGLKESLQFFRWRDSTTFVDMRKNWNPPLYRFAPNYLRDLSSAASAEAAAELAEFKSAWPEAQRRMRQEQRETEERAEALRIAAEKEQKAAARDKKKKQRAAVPIAKEAPVTEEAEAPEADQEEELHHSEVHE